MTWQSVDDSARPAYSSNAAKKNKRSGYVVAKVRTNRLVLAADDAIAPKAPEAKQTEKEEKKKIR